MAAGDHRTLISLIVAFGLMRANRDKPVTGTTMLMVLVGGVYPLLGLVTQLVAYRGLTVLLKLLDVLKREANAHTSESREHAGK